jgi:hypothetical protein
MRKETHEELEAQKVGIMARPRGARARGGGGAVREAGFKLVEAEDEENLRQQAQEDGEGESQNMPQARTRSRVQLPVGPVLFLCSICGATW